MTFYLVVVAVAAVLLPFSYKRSGSMTHYVTFTGAPVVWVLLAIAGAAAVIVHRAGDPTTAQEVFTGGLIGTGFAQIVLLRRGLGALSKRDDTRPPTSATDDDPADDDLADDDPADDDRPQG